jgi:hypothetical protein
VLAETKDDPDAVSAENFCLWMADGAGMAGSEEERVWLDKLEQAHLSRELGQE